MNAKQSKSGSQAIGHTRSNNEVRLPKIDSVHSFISAKDVIPAGISSYDQSKKPGRFTSGDSFRSSGITSKVRQAVASPKLTKLIGFKGTGSAMDDRQRRVEV